MEPVIDLYSSLKQWVGEIILGQNYHPALKSRAQCYNQYQYNQ